MVDQEYIIWYDSVALLFSNLTIQHRATCCAGEVHRYGGGGPFGVQRENMTRGGNFYTQRRLGRGGERWWLDKFERGRKFREVRK